MDADMLSFVFLESNGKINPKILTKILSSKRLDEFRRNCW